MGVETFDISIRVEQETIQDFSDSSEPSQCVRFQGRFWRVLSKIDIRDGLGGVMGHHFFLQDETTGEEIDGALESY